MVDPATASLIAAAVSAAGSVGGGYLAGRSSGKETKLQRTQRKLIDQLLASLTGSGPYSHLFQTDEAAFQKSFVEPSKALFRNQIAPQIQQQYIASGQQRGTGLDDQLLRAGVDLDQMLNQSYLEFQNQGKDRMQNMLNSILNQGSGGTQAPSSGQAFGQAAAGYLSSDAFSKDVSNILKSQSQTNANTGQTRKGFEDDLNAWNQQPRGLS